MFGLVFGLVDSVRVGNSVRVRYRVRVRVSGLPVLGNGLSELFFCESPRREGSDEGRRGGIINQYANTSWTPQTGRSGTFLIID